MSLLRRVVLATVLLLVIVAYAGCRSPATSYDLDVVGCAPAHAQRAPGRPTVLDITAGPCGYYDPVSRVVSVVWSQLPDDVDTVRIRVAGRPTPPTVLTRADLARRHGPIPHHDRGNSVVLVPLLLLAFVAVLTGTALAGWAVARAGVFIVFVRRS